MVIERVFEKVGCDRLPHRTPLQSLTKLKQR